jgi:hypothetical protein
MRALITGFTGSHMSEDALGCGAEVYSSVRWRSKMENIEHLRSRLSLIECDLRDLSTVENLFETSIPGYVIRLAAHDRLPRVRAPRRSHLPARRRGAVRHRGDAGQLLSCGSPPSPRHKRVEPRSGGGELPPPAPRRRGAGPEAAPLRALSGPPVEHCGCRGDAEVARLYARCCGALIFPSVEDFRTTPHQAMAAGHCVHALAPRRGPSRPWCRPAGPGRRRASSSTSRRWKTWRSPPP